MDMPRPPKDRTVEFVVGLYAEMKPQQRRSLMMQLMAATFDPGENIEAGLERSRAWLRRKKNPKPQPEALQTAENRSQKAAENTA